MTMEATTGQAPVNRARYRRIVRYFAGVFVHMLMWEIGLRAILGRRFVGRSAMRRWQGMARGYRTLAVELGGVLIKLGQFLSVRVDVLPQVVTAELAGLQDEVPPVAYAEVRAVVEAEYGRPIDGVFVWFRPVPEAAASLAQVHRATLRGGDEVVVKVQRPHIEEIVETDLRAIQTAARWLKRYRPVGKRVDLDRLFEEFGHTTRNELDFVAEGRNAERFARNFAGDDHVRIPRVYAEGSTRRVLIMENVADLKIGDSAALEAAGIDRKEVARRLVDIYLKQVFVDNFVHADPHPGNLFVQPWGESFRLVFVDFGMVASIPEGVRQHVRDFLLGFATQDAGRMVRAYQGAGVLLPGADVARLEQVEAELMARYSGLTLRQAQQVAMTEWHSLAREYRDLLFEMPFQFPTELLFVGRAIALLIGMATTLDPDLDPWQSIVPFAERVAADEARRGWKEIVEELGRMARLVVSLPGQADRFFAQASRGELTVRASWTPEATRTVRRVETAVNRLAWAVIFAALLAGAVTVYVAQGGGAVSYALFALAAAALAVVAVRR